MNYILNYIKPELIAVALVLYFIGIGIKRTELIKDKFIPAILGVVGIILCLIWVFATCTCGGLQDTMMAVFTAVVQGILSAGLSTYVNQLIKQSKKRE